MDKNLPVIGHLHSEVLDIPIYEYNISKERICITMPFSTAPGAAGTIEELHAMGCNKFIICGGAGFFAVSKYYDIPLAQLLYAGDDVSGENWDNRNWDKQKKCTCKSFLYISNFTDIFIVVQKIISWKAGKSGNMLTRRFAFVPYRTNGEKL